ncbi:MAG: hypothetical protein NZZ60_07010, partial [Bacteroidia bacterium]|nr:hypothetical protein [Bacteroidia bacterium]
MSARLTLGLLSDFCLNKKKRARIHHGCLLATGFILVVQGLFAQNVGIGTNAPTHKLHVAGSGRFDDVLELNRPASGGWASILYMRNANVNRLWQISVEQTSGRLDFLSQNTSTSVYSYNMTLDVNGNVGIGYWAPSE